MAGPDARAMVRTLLGFARVLRQAGVDAGPERVQAMLTAADTLDVTERRGTYWAGRLTLCSGPDDVAVYDAAFAAYFDGLPPARGPRIPRPTLRRPSSLFAPEPPGGGDRLTGREREPDAEVAVLASSADVLRRRDVAALSAPERAEVDRMVSLLDPGTAMRASRRHRPAPSGRVDPARTVRHMLRAGGEPTRLAHRRRRAKPRRLVLLLDVSGSMTPYADSLLRFGHAACRRRPSSTEVFTVGTRLTRVTRALRHRDPDAALSAASEAIPDWHGGTRLADALAAFLDRWGRRGVARGAIVVVASDGWERGDPAELGEQMARLARLAHRVVWVNPHRSKTGYAPLAAGMAAALPHVDEFVAGHSLDSLERLVQVIARA